jgi:hypothetical protein
MERSDARRETERVAAGLVERVVGDAVLEARCQRSPHLWARLVQARSLVFGARAVGRVIGGEYAKPILTLALNHLIATVPTTDDKSLAMCLRVFVQLRRVCPKWRIVADEILTGRIDLRLTNLLEAPAINRIFLRHDLWEMWGRSMWPEERELTDLNSVDLVWNRRVTMFTHMSVPDRRVVAHGGRTHALTEGPAPPDLEYYYGERSGPENHCSTVACSDVGVPFEALNPHLWLRMVDFVNQRASPFVICSGRTPTYYAHIGCYVGDRIGAGILRCNKKVARFDCAEFPSCLRVVGEADEPEYVADWRMLDVPTTRWVCVRNDYELIWLNPYSRRVAVLNTFGNDYVEDHHIVVVRETDGRVTLRAPRRVAGSPTHRRGTHEAVNVMLVGQDIDAVEEAGRIVSVVLLECTDEVAFLGPRLNDPNCIHFQCGAIAQIQEWCPTRHYDDPGILWIIGDPAEFHRDFAAGRRAAYKFVPAPEVTERLERWESFYGLDNDTCFLMRLDDHILQLVYELPGSDATNADDLAIEYTGADPDHSSSMTWQEQLAAAGLEDVASRRLVVRIDVRTGNILTSVGTIGRLVRTEYWYGDGSDFG